MDEINSISAEAEVLASDGNSHPLTEPERPVPFFNKVHEPQILIIMLGKLNETQIENLLKEQVIGRIACHALGETYIVPINYVYRNGYIYGHSAEGKKIRMMRENPQVCFEAEHIHSVFSWQTVIANGIYEEITNIDEKQQAMQAIIHRIMPLVTSAEGHPSHGITEKDSEVGTIVELVIYRVKLIDLSGRFEKS